MRWPVYSYLKIVIAITAFSAAAAAIEGCATADRLGSEALKYVFEPDPTVVQAKVQVAKDVNPDSRGRPSPVKTRFYLLESVSVFKSANFFQLKEQDQELLEKETKRREERVFKPGDEAELELSLPAAELPDYDRVYVAVMVGYWDLDHAEWRAVLEVEPEETTEVMIEIGRSEVSIKLVD